MNFLKFYSLVCQWMTLMLKYIRSVYWIYEYITFIIKTEENVCFSPMPICKGLCTGGTLNGTLMLFWGVPQGNYLRQKMPGFLSVWIVYIIVQFGRIFKIIMYLLWLS